MQKKLRKPVVRTSNTYFEGQEDFISGWRNKVYVKNKLVRPMRIGVRGSHSEFILRAMENNGRILSKRETSSNLYHGEFILNLLYGLGKRDKNGD